MRWKDETWLHTASTTFVLSSLYAGVVLSLSSAVKVTLVSLTLTVTRACSFTGIVTVVGSGVVVVVVGVVVVVVGRGVVAAGNKVCDSVISTRLNF